MDAIVWFAARMELGYRPYKSYRPDDPGFESMQESEIPRCGAGAISCSMGTEDFLERVVRLGREVDQSRLLLGLRMSRATPVLPLCTIGSWTRMPLPFCCRNKNCGSSCRGVARGYYGSPSYDVTSHIPHTKSLCLYVAEDVLQALVTHKT
jgi:hypothetical protein